MEEHLAGGADRGAVLVDGTVRRATGPWTPAVHALLLHLEDRGFAGAPRVLGLDGRGREVLTLVPGETVGDRRPWPAWVHSDEALPQVGRWLRAYHRAVADHVPSPTALWREGGTWTPGAIVGHGDPAPYNAAWTSSGLTGFFDWDDAGPVTPEDDLAWFAFAWTPLHARRVVEAEGFTAFGARRARLEVLLGTYGWEGTTDDVLALVGARLERQVETVRAVAAAGDPAYVAMLERGQDGLLEQACRELREV